MNEKRHPAPTETTNGDRILYHYTNPKGLRGILENRCIWATSIRHLEDTSEFDYPLDLFEREIQAQLATAEQTAALLLTKLASRLTRLRDARLAYVASFCEQKNLRKMWKKYCPDGGYCIGFRKSDLLWSTAEASSRFRTHYFDWTMKKCIYDPREQRKRVAAFVSRYTNTVRCYFLQYRGDREQLLASWSSDDPDTPFPQLYLSMLGDVNTNVPILKRSRYYYEQEYRIFSPIDPHGRRSFRADEHATPYLEMPLASDNDRLRIAEIYVAPHKHQIKHRATAIELIGEFGAQIESPGIKIETPRRRGLIAALKNLRNRFF